MAKPCSLPHCYKSETAAALLAKVQLREQDALRAAPRAGAAPRLGLPSCRGPEGRWADSDRAPSLLSVPAFHQAQAETEGRQEETAPEGFLKKCI